MIFTLLSLPLDGFKFILNTLVKVAEEQWTDEYVETEAKILRHLRDIQERKRELAGAEPRSEEGLSGKVQEGSGASVTFGHQERDH
jgi:hypothetical protein